MARQRRLQAPRTSPRVTDRSIEKMIILRSKYDREYFIKSLGSWSQVLSLRRRGEKIASGERIWGCSEFVRSVLDEVNEREKETS
jgi:hypothetical protein